MQVAGWAGAPWGWGAWGEIEADAGYWRELGHCLWARETRGQSLAHGMARASMGPPHLVLTLCTLVPSQGPVQVADGLHRAQTNGSRVAAIWVPRLCWHGALSPSHAVC